jgi:hypothetical protein
MPDGEWLARWSDGINPLGSEFSVQCCVAFSPQDFRPIDVLTSFESGADAGFVWAG